KLSRYLALSEGEDKPFSLDTSLRLWGEKDGIRRPLEAFSAGERDLAEFCARLAVSDAVFTAEPPFYLLDDPFVHLDNRRYAAMMRLLKNLSAERQILYFVCRKELSGVDFGTTE
ncbi:MAG: hypothetical protein MJ078_08195, partial [Clostridia bacterium]|nr:hypothetical protein [Clostridia bacterium]